MGGSVASTPQPEPYAYIQQRTSRRTHIQLLMMPKKKVSLMNQNIHKFVTNRVEVSHKILCVLLACMLLIQTGCQTTRVLKSLEQEELKTEKHRSLDLKVGQLIRITYLDGSSTKLKRQIGQVKSVTSDAIVVTYNSVFRDKDVRISFKHIKKIEMIKKKVDIGKSLAVTALVISISFFLVVI